MVAAVASDDDVTVLQSDAGVLARSEVGVAGIAREAFELLRERDSVALGQPAREADVLSGAVVVALRGGVMGERCETLDSLLGYRHEVWEWGVGVSGARQDKDRKFLCCPIGEIL